MLQAQGEANESEKNWDGAIIAFNHVLTMDPHRTGIHYQLGRVYLGRFRDSGKPEDREEAMREFRAELENDPGNGNAAYELANLQAESGDTTSAAAMTAQRRTQGPREGQAPRWGRPAQGHRQTGPSRLHTVSDHSQSPPARPVLPAGTAALPRNPD